MNEENFVVPQATLTEQPAAYELKIVVPGVGKEEADLHIEGRTLMLKTHARFQQPAGFRPVVAEFEHANYVLSADLPEMADPATIKAQLADGVLIVTLQKRAETQPRRIVIG